jgi:MFS family permease
MRQYLQFLTRHWAILSFGLITVFWGNFGQSFFVSWYGAAIQSSLNLSATAYGSSYSLATLAAGLSMMVVGGWIDRWPLRRFTTMVALGLLTATCILSFSSNIVLLTIGFFFLRLFGQGLLPHIGLTTTAKFFNVNRGKAVSIAVCGVPLGEIILPLMAVALISAVGWQNSWRLIALTIPFVFLPLVWWLLKLEHPPEYRSEQEGPGNASGGRREMLADYRFWLVLPAILAGPFIITGIFIHQGFILEQKGWTPVFFATCFVFYGIAHWFSSMLAGLLVDRWSAQALLRFYLLPLILGIFTAATVNGQWIATVLMSTLGLTIGSAATITGALWAEVYGTTHLGSIRSFIASVIVISTSLSPVLFGLLIDRGISVALMFGLIGLYLVVAVLMVCFSYRTTGPHSPDDTRPVQT